VLYKFLRALLLLIFRFFFRLSVRGEQHIPREGPLIITANHISVLDPIVVGIAIKRRVYFMAKEELFNNPVFGNFLRRLGAFPVKRSAADRAAIRQALALLKDGKILGLFPEGTRSLTGRLQEAQPGAALLAMKAGVPIVPIGITGTNLVRPAGTRLFKLAKIQVQIGKPLELKGTGVNNPKEASFRIMSEIGKLLGQEINARKDEGNGSPSC